MVTWGLFTGWGALSQYVCIQIMEIQIPSYLLQPVWQLYLYHGASQNVLFSILISSFVLIVFSSSVWFTAAVIHVFSFYLYFLSYHCLGSTHFCCGDIHPIFSLLYPIFFCPQYPQGSIQSKALCYTVLYSDEPA